MITESYRSGVPEQGAAIILVRGDGTPPYSVEIDPGQTRGDFAAGVAAEVAMTRR